MGVVANAALSPNSEDEFDFSIWKETAQFSYRFEAKKRINKLKFVSRCEKIKATPSDLKMPAQDSTCTGPDISVFAHEVTEEEKLRLKTPSFPVSSLTFDRNENSIASGSREDVRAVQLCSSCNSKIRGVTLESSASSTSLLSEETNGQDRITVNESKEHEADLLTQANMAQTNIDPTTLDRFGQGLPLSNSVPDFLDSVFLSQRLSTESVKSYEKEICKVVIFFLRSVLIDYI